MRKLLSLLILGILMVQPFATKTSMAQTFVPTNLPPPPPSIPNYGTPTAVRSNWNVVSILNAVIAAAVAGNPDVDLNASFNVNSIVGNIATADTYGPTQNGFYINHLGFESELAKGVTLFGDARNQDDFNRAGSFNLRDGHLKYDLQYTKLINRQMAEEVWPNSSNSFVTQILGFPETPGHPQPNLDHQLLYDLPGFNPNQYFYPRISDYLVNDLQYIFNNGFGAFVSNTTRFMTGQQLLEIYGLQGPIGRDNVLSTTSAGLNYTSPSNLQIYADTWLRNWNNKQNISGLTGLPLDNTSPFLQPCFQNRAPKTICVGDDAAPATIPNFKDDDTFWSANEAGLRIPLGSSLSFTGEWTKMNKRTAGIFGSSYFDSEGFSPFVAALTESGPDAGQGDIPTGLEPTFVLRQYRAGFDYIGGTNNAAIRLGHWEEDPNNSVLYNSRRTRNNVFGAYRHLFGSQSVSLSGGWEQETVDRTIDLRESRFWYSTSPLVNSAFSSQLLGTAVYDGNQVSFTPAPGVAIAPFTTPIPVFGPTKPCSVSGAKGCGTNLTSYPVYGIINYNGALFPTTALVGRQAFTYDDFVVDLSASGPITSTLNYSFTIHRLMANNSFFRTDPQNEWKDHYELGWNPGMNLTLNASLDTDDNSASPKWLFPYLYHENTFNLFANYMVAPGFSLNAGYRNYTQKINFTSPVMNTGTSNFIGPTQVVGGSPIPTVGSGKDIGVNAPFAQYYALPLDTIEQNIDSQDQEISVGLGWTVSHNWGLNFNYAHSRPQNFQNILLTNPTTLSSIFGPYMPNVPAGFYANLPELLVMQAVDGRENTYSLDVSRTLKNGSSVGLMLDLIGFKNLAPRITAIGLPCGSKGIPACSDGTPFGLNPVQYGASLDNGQILSISVYYQRHF